MSPVHNAEPRSCTSSRGSATVELVILAPALLIVLGVVIVFGRLGATAAAVDQAAAEGARSLSISRTSNGSDAVGRTIRDSLRRQGVTCVDLRVKLDTSGLDRRAGTVARVAVDISCVVRISDQALPGLPGRRTVTARAVSVVDTYRGRS